jgi:hypothetical protein
MSKFYRIITSFLISIIFTTSIVGSSINNTEIGKLISKGEQNQLAEIQPDGRKKLKEKLKLSYTHPDFEKMLDSSQKKAILNSLKKWKLDLPVNNTFTITSIGNLKDPVNKIVYMWSSTPNINWDVNKIPSGNDFETGDPRFIRTEFNILLNKTIFRTWKATIEQDNDLKTELNNIAESEISTEEKNTAFGNNKADNLFTEKSEILIDVKDTPEENKNETTSAVKVKEISFLDILLKSPKVSAGDSDYSWPWENGATYNTNLFSPPNIRWHTDSYDSSEKAGLDGGTRALDIEIPGNTPILAPITGVAYRKCTDQNNSTFVIRPNSTPNGIYGGNGMRIVHLTPNNNLGNSQPNISYTKGQQIGTVKQGLQSVDYGCGYGYGDHIHIKLLADNMIIDNQTITYGTNYNSFTSQIGGVVTSQNQSGSTPPTPQPNSTYSKFLFKRAGTNQCINVDNPANGTVINTYDCDPNDPAETWEVIPRGNNQYSYRRLGTNKCMEAFNPVTNGPVYTWECDGSQEQMFGYNYNTKLLYRLGTGSNNQCVAKGNPINYAAIKMYDCGSANQNFQWDALSV